MKTLAKLLCGFLLAVVSVQAAAQDAPIVRHDCTIRPATRPRPCDGDIDITRNTSIYFELALPFSGNYPHNGVERNTVVMTITPEGGPTETVFGPDLIWAPGWSGRALEDAYDGGEWLFGFYSVPDEPLQPETVYTVEVSGQTRQGIPIDPETSTWSFTTRRDQIGRAHV